MFQIRVKSIPLTIVDIYFLTGLSRRGAPISLSGSARGGESVRDYIRRYCREGSQPSKDGKINIRDVTNRSLRTILFTFARMAGSAALHVANRSYMQYVVECLEPKVFNWCDTILFVMKEQLTKVKNGILKNFGYSSILTAFSLEKIPLMQPQYIPLGLPPPTEPRMQRWVDHMSRHAGQSQVSFSDTFFGWFNCQDMVFSKYLYAGMDFQGDPDLVLPAGEQWGAIGKISTISLFIVSLYNVLVLYSLKTTQNSCAHADVGPVRPVARLRVLATAPTGEVVGRAILHDLDVDETLSAL